LLKMVLILRSRGNILFVQSLYFRILKILLNSKRYKSINKKLEKLWALRRLNREIY